MRKWYLIGSVLVVCQSIFSAELEFTTLQLGKGLQARAAALEQGKSIAINSINGKMLQYQDSELYQMILREISDSYQSIGQELAANILRYRYESNMGQKNFAGFSWQKPFQFFSLRANRALAPDLFDDQRWIVDDTLEIEISAFSFLEHLRDAGEIQIAPEQLAAYAGISFRRSFRYVHFAKNYLEGLGSNFKKLFLAFTYFSFENCQKMDADEVLSQEDALKYKFGGLVGGSWASVFNASAGLWAQYQKISKVTMQTTSQKFESLEGNQERLHVSVEKEDGQQFTASGRLQLELYHLLRLTVLYFDLSYHYQEIFKGYFSFSSENLVDMKKRVDERDQFNLLLKLQNVDLRVLRQYLFQSEQRVTTGRGLSYGVLLAGKKMQSSMEQITLSKGSLLTNMIRLFTTNLSYLENLSSKLLIGIINRLFDSNLPVSQYVSSRLQEMKLDYEQGSANPNDLITGIHGSIVFRQDLQVGKYYFWNATRNQRIAVEFAENFTTLPESIKELLARGKINGPLTFHTSIRVTGHGINYFMQLDLSQFVAIASQICHSASDQDNCQQELVLCYQRFIGKWQQEKIIHGPLLRDLLDQINSKIVNWKFYQQLFSSEQVFINGMFSGKTAEEQNFASSYRFGKFAGQGIVDRQLHRPNFPLVIEY